MAPFFLSYLMYFKEDNKEKEHRKDKDQTNKNMLQINFGVGHDRFCLGKTLNYAASSTPLRGLLSYFKLSNSREPRRQSIEIVTPIIIINNHTKSIHARVLGALLMG